MATWTFSGPRKAQSAQIILSYGDAGNWLSRHWKTLPAKIKGQTCSIELPAAPDSLLHQRRRGRFRQVPLLDADGSRRRGKTGLERRHRPLQRRWLRHVGRIRARAGHLVRPPRLHEPDRRHRRARPASSRLRSPRALTGSFRSYSTAGVPYRLSLWVKADKPTEVKIWGVGDDVLAAPEQKFATSGRGGAN